ncbi:hypothetical protein CLF_106407 [Clonorchis sinensis]|uniref:Uncharacterized protein n=1 Tax=Clonorchis sinensis TaxID=79923 RepID=G7YF49_CLOSI|nr:hypothetical protein CLF_106407 [Clonorchis sinensis]
MRQPGVAPSVEEKPHKREIQLGTSGLAKLSNSRSNRSKIPNRYFVNLLGMKIKFIDPRGNAVMLPGLANGDEKPWSIMVVLLVRVAHPTTHHYVHSFGYRHPYNQSHLSYSERSQGHSAVIGSVPKLADLYDLIRLWIISTMNLEACCALGWGFDLIIRKLQWFSPHFGRIRTFTSEQVNVHMLERLGVDISVAELSQVKLQSVTLCNQSLSKGIIQLVEVVDKRGALWSIKSFPQRFSTVCSKKCPPWMSTLSPYLLNFSVDEIMQQTLGALQSTGVPDMEWSDNIFLVFEDEG